MSKIAILSLICLAMTGCASTTTSTNEAAATPKREWKLNDYSRTDEPYATASKAFKECIGENPSPEDKLVGYCEGIGIQHAYQYFLTSPKHD